MLGLYLNAHNFVSDRLTREEKGATAVEYGIMVALIAVALIVLVTLLGDSLGDLFEKTSCELRGGTFTAGTVTGNTMTAGGSCTMPTP